MSAWNATGCDPAVAVPKKTIVHMHTNVEFSGCESILQRQTETKAAAENPKVGIIRRAVLTIGDKETAARPLNSSWVGVKTQLSDLHLPAKRGADALGWAINCRTRKRWSRKRGEHATIILRPHVGGVAERLKAAVLKTVRPERVSWVRIPPPPPKFSRFFQLVNLGRIVFHRDATSSGTREGSSYSASDKRREAAATFCSRCSIEEVPGMGSIMGDRRSSQASAT